MKRGIHLYIDGREIEFDKDPQILYNYAVSDVASPASVKNAYSKTLDIPATKNNSKVFDSIWNLDATGFDPGKKIPFTIYVDSEVYETGYCRLDGIRKRWNTATFTVSFFGGLGEFIHSLDATEGGSKKTLADLVYRYEGEGSEEVDLDFVIDMDTVKEAWDYVEGWSTKWRFINFAPAYNGTPSDGDFDSDKVAVFGLHADEHQEDGKTYRPYEGWTIDVLPRKYTGSEMREFRSYLQRPVLRVMEVIKACCLPENNNGYKVNLDPTWFTYSNPYWYSSYVTLPMLSSLEFTASEPEQGGSLSVVSTTSGSAVSNRVSEYWEDKTLSVSGLQGDANYGIKATVQLTASVAGATANELYVTAGQDNPYLRQRDRFGYNGAVVVQLVAYDSFGNAVAGSTPVWLRSPRWGYSQYTDPVSLTNWGFSFVYPSENIDVMNGNFEKRNGVYVWKDDLVMRIDNVPPGATLRLITYKISNYGLGSSYAGGDPTMHMWEVNRHGTDDYYQWTWNWKDLTSFGFTFVDTEISRKSEEGVRSGAVVTKKLLLSTGYSPAEFLLSYCKLFGLLIRKDPAKKEIDILSRGSFYNGGTVDISDLIDRDDIEVKPSAFDKRWYDFTPTESASEYGDDYQKVYGERYGQKVVDTGYQFNTETEQVFKDNIFHGAVEVLERSDAFAVVPTREWELIYNYKGYSYLLYNINDPTDSYEVEVPRGSTVDLVTGLDGDNLYYDLFPKVQLHGADNSPADGDGVLLLYRGTQNLYSGNRSLGYRLTDDNGWMKYLNVNACWLVSNSDYDPDDNHLMISVDACPSFGRYIQYGPSGYITKSLDFGEPKTLYIPGALSMPAGTLYDQCWKDYIADLYSPDTRVVTCKVRWKGRMSIDDLRKFYWFDNCLWRIDKVEDWDMMSRGLTKITFVKVNDESAYATTTPTTDPDLQVTLDTYIVPPQGGTVHFSVVTSDNGPWYAEYDPDIVTMSPDHDSASTVSGTITIGPANADREIPIWFFADPASQKVVITQATATGSVNYLGTSYPGGSASDWIPQAGGTAYFEVYSPDGPWSIAGSRNYMTNPTPSSGQATNSTIVAITFGSNGDVNSRFGTAVLTFGGGLTVQSTQVNQYGTVTVSLSHSSFHLDSGAHIIRFWATVRGGLVTYSYADPYGMIGTTTYNYTASTQEEGRYDYSFTVNVYSNESGSSRNAYILINDANTGTEVARVYIAQDA